MYPSKLQGARSPSDQQVLASDGSLQIQVATNIGVGAIMFGGAISSFDDHPALQAAAAGAHNEHQMTLATAVTGLFCKGLAGILPGSELADPIAGPSK